MKKTIFNFLVLLFLALPVMAADSKISDLTADATPTSDDLLSTVNDPGGTPANRQATIANVVKLSGWTDGGANVFLTTTTDNVGIGTINPTASLCVGSTCQFAVSSAGAISGVAGITNTSGYTYASGATSGTIMSLTANSLTSGIGYGISSSSNSFTGNLISATYSGTSTGRGALIQLTNASASGDALKVINAGTGLTFIAEDVATDASPFIINAAGAVGIGTTTVLDGSLQVLGDNVAVGTGTNTNATGAGELYVQADVEVDGTLYFDVVDGNGAADMDYGSADITDHTFTSDGGTVILDGSVAASAGVNLGTSQALIGTTAMTIGNNAQTVAVNSSDWDIDATGVQTGMGNITSNGTVEAATLTEGGNSVLNITQEAWQDGGTTITTTTTTDAVGIGTTTAVSSTILTIAGDNVQIGLGGSNGIATSAGELYVVGDLEVDGTTALGVASVTDDAYAAGWNGSSNIPTKNAVYDKIEALGAGDGGFTDDGTTVRLTTVTDNVGIGTSTQSGTAKVTVVGGIAADTLSGTGSGPMAITNGNVGIGTFATPTVLLHVGATAGSPTSVAAGDMYIENDLEVDGTLYIASCSGAGCGAGAAGGWTDGGTNVYTTTTTDLVGIGTTTPSAALEIIESGEEPFMVSSVPSGNGDFFIIDSGGNVGVGTIEPTNKLNIVNGNISLFRPDAGYPEISFRNSSNNSVDMGYAPTGDTYPDSFYFFNNASSATAGIRFATNGTERMLVNVNGNVGIGTTAPVGAMVVMNGNVGVGTHSPVGRLQVGGTGNVGIGTLIPPQNLYVVGTTQTTVAFKAANNVGISTTKPNPTNVVITGGIITTWN